MRINLPEQTWIDHKPASFGSRALAYAADMLVRWTFYLLLLFATSILLPTFLGKLFASLKLGTIVFAFFIIIFFIVEISYPILFEVYRHGVTPGKKLLKIRVVDERGLSPSFRASMLRNIFFLIDLLPATGIVGLVSMMVNKNNQRIGDVVAKTLVIHDAEEDFSNIALTDASDNLLILPLELYNVIEQFLKRSALFTDQAKLQTLNKISAALANFNTRFDLSLDKPIIEREEILKELFLNSAPKRKSQTKSSSDISINWKETRKKINEIIGSFQKFLNQQGAQSKNDIRSFSNAYQHICQIYSYLSAYYPDSAEARKAAYLTREGRKFVYGKRLDQLNDSKLSFLDNVSVIFSKIKYHMLASFMLAFLPGLICSIAITINPNLSWHFINEQTAESLSAGKLWTESIQGESDIAAASIMTNNIKVAITAFVLGITAGVGTVYVLIFNGIHLAGIFTSLAIYGMAHKLFNFVVAHGFLEISIIIVAGGCGLYIADALINPGFISRREKVQIHAREMIDLIIFNSLCLVVAGIVEGYISPYPQISFALKLGIGLTLGALYWLVLLKFIAKKA